MTRPRHTWPAGAIVSPINGRLMRHELATRGGRGKRLELCPLGADYREALAWRLEKLLPLCAAPAYRGLWTSPDPDKRDAVLEAVFLSGDFHFDTRVKERRQIVARWIHARLMGTTIRRPSAELEQGALV